MKRGGRTGAADPLHKAGVYHHAAWVLISDTIMLMNISLSDQSGGHTMTKEMRRSMLAIPDTAP